jgi:hypothetical protein
MSLVRINLSTSYSPEQRRIVSDVVYTAMIEIGIGRLETPRCNMHQSKDLCPPAIVRPLAIYVA